MLNLITTQEHSRFRINFIHIKHVFPVLERSMNVNELCNCYIVVMSKENRNMLAVTTNFYQIKAASIACFNDYLFVCNMF